MSLASIGTGATVIAFWSVVVLRGGLPALIDDVHVARWHVLAEMLTGAALIAGGAAVALAPDAAWSRPLAGIALGTLIYALVGSPGLYHGRPVMRWAFVLGWTFTIPAVVMLLVDA